MSNLPESLDVAHAFPSRELSLRVLEANQLSTSGYELLLERRNLAFAPGMVIVIHGQDPTEGREYSIASGTNDPHLRVLYRYIPNGRLTSRLVKLQAGDGVDVTGPFGQFVLRDPDRPMVFVATGTGIAPCRSFVRSYADLQATIVHGVRNTEDLFYREEFEAALYVPCVSRDAHADYPARVTEFIATCSMPDRAHYYLCGAYAMIHDVTALLAKRGVGPEAIFAEPYYYAAP